jgi:hypothetical protein
LVTPINSANFSWIPSETPLSEKSVLPLNVLAASSNTETNLASLSDLSLKRIAVGYCCPNTASISSSENSKTVGTVNGLTKLARDSLSGFPEYTFVVVSNFLKKTMLGVEETYSSAHAASLLWTN